MNEQATELSHQFGLSVAFVYLLEWLKTAGWFPWLTADTDRATRIASMSLAALTSIGFRFALTQGDFWSGGTLAVTFPAAQVILDTLVHAVGQFGAQQGFYEVAIKAPARAKTAD